MHDFSLEIENWSDFADDQYIATQSITVKHEFKNYF